MSACLGLSNERKMVEEEALKKEFVCEREKMRTNVVCMHMQSHMWRPEINPDFFRSYPPCLLMLLRG